MKPGEIAFHAIGIEIGHKEIKADCAPLTQIFVELEEEWDEEKRAWIKLPLKNGMPTVFACELFLYKADGSVSDFRWKTMMEVLGWNGESLESLQALNIKGKRMNVTLGKDEKGYWKMTWLNKYGDVQSGIPSTKKEISKVAGSKLSQWTAKGPVAKIQSALGSGFDADLSISESDVPF